MPGCTVAPNETLFEPAVAVDPLSEPVPVRDQFTVRPDSGLPNWSVTLTTNGSLSAALMLSVWPPPDTATIDDALPAVAVAGMATLNPIATAAKLCGPT